MISKDEAAEGVSCQVGETDSSDYGSCESLSLAVVLSKRSTPVLSDGDSISLVGELEAAEISAVR